VVADLDFENSYWGGEIAPHQHEAPLLSTAPAIARPGSEDESIKGMLTEILSRVDQLEKRGAQASPEDVHTKDAGMDSMQQYVQNLVTTTLHSSDEVSTRQSNAAALPHYPAPKAEILQEKKRGWFGFLFRAA
jgi:hypothetical protein